MQMTVAAVPPQREPTPEAERILMVDFTTTQARAKVVAPYSERSRPGPLQPRLRVSYLHQPPMGVDRMYHQLVEIHTITTMQLAKCAHWRRSDPTSSPVWAKTRQQRPAVEPSVATMAPPSLTHFLLQALLWRWGWHTEPQTRRQAGQGDTSV
jgi:hypothetical protein